MDSQALRRAAALSRHFMPSPECISFSGVGMAPTANDENGKSDKYRRVHGGVPSHPASWRACSVDGPPFTDIIYEKAVGEGIAKVGLLLKSGWWIDKAGRQVVL